MNAYQEFRMIGSRPIRPDGLDKVTGRVTYSQQILKEFGWITEGRGLGVDPGRPGSGYSQV